MNVENVSKIEWFDSRFYRIDFGDGSHDFYPSATTKLGVSPKPFLAKWRGDIGNREADLRMFEASQRGIRIHSAWETLCNEGIVVYNPPLNPTYSESQIDELREKANGLLEIVKYQDEMLDVWKLRRFLEIVDPIILETEKTVYSHKYRDAGTLDTLLKIEAGEYQLNGTKTVKFSGGVYVVDLKTGNFVGKDAERQTACYANCVSEMGIAKPVGTLILHTGATTKTGIPGFKAIVREKDEVLNDFKSYRRIAELWDEENPGAKPVVFEFPSILSIKN